MCAQQVIMSRSVTSEVPEHCRSPQNSGAHAMILDDRNDAFRGGTRDSCSKYNAGRKAHDHIKHIRAIKSAVKRQTL